MNEKELIERLCKNESESFQILMDTYSQPLFTLAYSMVHQRQDAEDIVQDVFITVHKSIHQFKAESSIRTWLYRITLNKTINFIKRQKMNRLQIGFEQLFNVYSNDDSPSGRIELDETSLLLHKIIDKLPVRQREAFVLYHYNEHSYGEISDIMKISNSAVESLLFRARRLFQDNFLKLSKETQENLFRFVKH